MPMWPTEVTPRSATYAIAASSARSCCAGVGSGTTPSNRLIALSLKMPVGLPFRSRTMVPPSTSLVARVMPAARIAALLASAMWPSSRLTSTGWFAVTASIHSLAGSSPPHSE